MGLFEKFIGKNKKLGQEQNFRTFTAYTPQFLKWNGDIWTNVQVRSAVRTIAIHRSKMSVNFIGSASGKMRTLLEKNPNMYMTWSKFLSRISNIYEVQGTCFLAPIEDEYGNIIGIWPLLPSRCSLVSYQDEPYLKYQFQNGQNAAIELTACGLLIRDQYEDDFFGTNNEVLRETMELINIANKSVDEAVKSTATYRFMAKVTGAIKSEDISKESRRFTKDVLRNENSSILLFPFQYQDIKQIEPKNYTVDSSMKEAIKNDVNDYFGVNENIIQNKASTEELQSFYEGNVEPFGIQLSEVLTNMLFSQLEQGYGNRVIISGQKLDYMSTSDKISIARELGDRGAIKRNEIRELFHYPPLDDDLGNTISVRGEYYNLGEDKEKNGQEE